VDSYLVGTIAISNRRETYRTAVHSCTISTAAAWTQRHAASMCNSAADDFHGVGMDPTVGGVGAALGGLGQLRAGGLEELRAGVGADLDIGGRPSATGDFEES
jgi:hypothetical protein